MTDGDCREAVAVMHLAGLLWMKNRGSRMEDLSHGLAEEALTSSEHLV